MTDMVNINLVVNRLIELSNYGLTNLKIQKLLYYVYGVFLAVKNERPFDETPEAWQYGPVFPEVYHSLKIYGSEPVRHKLPSNSDTIPDRDIEQAIGLVFQHFGKLSEARLIQKTHEPGSPWAQVYERGKKNIVINDERIREYFKKRVIKVG